MGASRGQGYPRQGQADRITIPPGWDDWSDDPGAQEHAAIEVGIDGVGELVVLFVYSFPDPAADFDVFQARSITNTLEQPGTEVIEDGHRFTVGGRPAVRYQFRKKRSSLDVTCV